MRLSAAKILVLLLFSTPVMAGVTNLLYEEKQDACIVRISHDAVVGENGIIIVRASTKQYAYCKISQQTLSHAFYHGLVKLKENTTLAPVTRVSLGRLQSYPWMKEYLLASSKNNAQWDINKGKPVKGSRNKYVNRLLNSKKVLAAISNPLAEAGYQVKKVSCEKILINKEKLPYDAICWVDIAR